MKFMINNVFPTPVYITRSDSDLTSNEEIQKIIKEGMVDNDYNLSSENNYIFHENLKKSSSQKPQCVQLRYLVCSIV